MTDMNKENDNHFEDSQSDNSLQNKKRLLGLHPTRNLFVFVFFIVLVFFSVFFTIESLKPKLVVPRYNHSAVVLQDGRILITGGETIIKGKSVPLNTAEIYDPKTKKCTLIENKMNYARSNHTSILLPNGNVFIIGGGSQIPEIFNIETKTFYKLPVSSNIKDIAIAEKINNQKIIIVSPNNNVIEEFDIENNKFKKIGVFENGLNTNSRHLLNYNEVLFFPIERLSQTDLSSDPKEKVVISYYDYKKNIIGNITKPQSLFDFCVGNMISEVNNELVHFCYNNRLYAEIYDFKINKFIKRSSTSVFPKINYIAAKHEDIIFLLGGVKITGPLKRSNTIAIYDSKTNKIYEKKFKKINAVKGYSSVQIDKNLIIIGGLIGINQVTNKIQTIEIERILKWLQLKNLESR